MSGKVSQKGAVLDALETVYPDVIACDTPNCSLSAAGGRITEKIVQLTGNGASVENVFKVLGAIRILQIYAICTAEVEAPNITLSNCKFSIYDGTNTVDMCGTVDASGIEPNDLLVKTQDDAQALAWLDADNGGIYVEGGTARNTFSEGIAIQKTSTDTFVRFSYTGDVNTDVTLAFAIRWQPMTGTSDCNVA